MKNNIEVIAWKFIFDDKANIKYDRNIGKYILQRIYADNLVLRIEKVEKFNPYDYASFEDLHKELCLFYLES
jgi:hypothetical protein